MRKTIAVFSNPFGYGPTGVSISILKSLLGKIKDADIVFAGSGLCMEIVQNLPIKKVILDERDEKAIEKYLETLDSPYVIGSQNRFCIKVAKRLHIPCSFVDVLAWFWRVIPPDHLLADEIFWINFPNIINKVPEDQKNIHIVSGVVSLPSRKFAKKRQLIIHIGGAKYLLSGDMAYSYLNLIAKGLNALRESDFENIIFAGGLEAVSYLREKVVNESVWLASFPNDAFVDKISQSAHVVTTAGVSSTLESFSQEVPTSFLVPLNQSQLSFLDLLLENNCAPNYLNWNQYIKAGRDLKNLTEKETIEEIGKYSKTVDEDDKLSDRFVSDFVSLCTIIPENSNQVEMIRQLGHSGGVEIVNILIRKWGL